MPGIMIVEDFWAEEEAARCSQVPQAERSVYYVQGVPQFFKAGA